MTAEQIPLLPAGRVRRTRPLRPTAATHLPVARVALMLPLAHLDHPFDFEVPEPLSARAEPGVRVRVPFSGRLVDGFILGRAASSDRALSPLRSVHGPPVLTAEVATLCRVVADRYAGTLADVLRFAVPARHARAESRERPRAPEGAPGALGGVPDAWAAYDGGEALLARVGGSDPARALWLAGPLEPAADRVAELVHAVRARGRGVVVVVPDGADVGRFRDALCRRELPPALLTAELGPEARYASFLSVLRGHERVVLGTRAAVWAPVRDLGVIVVWDDGDEMLAEPQAPGWHAREVAALRVSSTPDVSLVLAGTTATLEAARMAQSGWLHPVTLPRTTLRGRMPRVQSAADYAARDPASAGSRVPPAAVAALRDGLALGPVLVSVPRSGYLPVLACAGCREPVTCGQCSSTMHADGPTRVPACPDHGAQPGWRCRLCGSTAVRAGATGARRTAEEFGRALPGAVVVTSSGDQRLVQVDGSRVVVATPGAEPDPGPSGYATLVVLDVAAALSRPGLRVAEEQLRRWMSAAALVRAADRGGRVLVVGEPDVREVQALIRWDPLGYAERELAERRELGLPPAVRAARLTGPGGAAGELAHAVAEQLGERVLRVSGPLPGPGDEVTWVLLASMAEGGGLAAALRREQSARSARRGVPVTLRMDPTRLL